MKKEETNLELVGRMQEKINHLEDENHDLRTRINHLEKTFAENTKLIESNFKSVIDLIKEAIVNHGHEGAGKTFIRKGK